MKFTNAAFMLIGSSSAACAFTPLTKGTGASSKSSIATNDNKPLYDPLGLYPKDATERKEGLLRPLEASSLSPEDDQKIVVDPLNLYAGSSDPVSENADMSASLPFLKRPPALDGTLAGDRGFDPFNFASDSDSLTWQRSAELKHARLAMLATVGWPLAELFHKPLAESWGLPQALNLHDRVPSVLNGGLDKVSPVFWVAALAAAATIETFSGAAGEIPTGNLGFDPLGLSKGRERYMEESELFNGRLAMLAITGFAIQEFATHDSVVDAIPIFFKPLNVVVEQLMASGAIQSV
eukprot:CAMPEP_0168845330 /NCGR_PEP_ID=MMETSP0727-20121128/9216_1 /TAXON_ID=265536 /ORGANISM="Amphiprora sp., Strain CCMP467" /LENGTH=293 /DNA_ID=CAMNT_0008899039 /DNA_START=29 /DNA_END=913 /DNA_ORIENTATION=-